MRLSMTRLLALRLTMSGLPAPRRPALGLSMPRLSTLRWPILRLPMPRLPALGLPVLRLLKPRLWYLSLEGSSCITRDKSFVNLPCNTINTVPQVLAMDWTPECNRVEEKSLEERIMSSEWI